MPDALIDALECFAEFDVFGWEDRGPKGGGKKHLWVGTPPDKGQRVQISKPGSRKRAAPKAAATKTTKNQPAAKPTKPATSTAAPKATKAQPKPDAKASTHTATPPPTAVPFNNESHALPAGETDQSLRTKLRSAMDYIGRMEPTGILPTAHVYSQLKKSVPALTPPIFAGLLSRASADKQVEPKVLNEVRSLDDASLAMMPKRSTRSGFDNVYGFLMHGRNAPAEETAATTPVGKSTSGVRFGPSKAKLNLSPEDAPTVRKQMMRLFGHQDTNKIPSLVGATDDAVVHVHFMDMEGGTLVVNVSSRDYDARRFIMKDGQGKTYIENSRIEIKEEKQSSGLGSEIFGRQVENAAAQGIAYIKATCAGDGRDLGKPDAYNGYYTWPRLGYDAVLGKPGENEDHPLNKAKMLFKANTIQEVFRTKKGRDWWRNNGTSLKNAKFDLAPGSKSLKILAKYLKERAKRKLVEKHAESPKGPSAVEEIYLNPEEEAALDRVWEEMDKEREDTDMPALHTEIDLADMLLEFAESDSDSWEAFASNPNVKYSRTSPGKGWKQESLQRKGASANRWVRQGGGSAPAAAATKPPPIGGKQLRGGTGGASIGQQLAGVKGAKAPGKAAPAAAPADKPAAPARQAKPLTKEAQATVDEVHDHLSGKNGPPSHAVALQVADKVMGMNRPQLVALREKLSLSGVKARANKTLAMEIQKAAYIKMHGGNAGKAAEWAKEVGESAAAKVAPEAKAPAAPPAKAEPVAPPKAPAAQPVAPPTDGPRGSIGGGPEAAAKAAATKKVSAKAPAATPQAPRSQVSTSVLQDALSKGKGSPELLANLHTATDTQLDRALAPHGGSAGMNKNAKVARVRDMLGGSAPAVEAAPAALAATLSSQAGKLSSQAAASSSGTKARYHASAAQEAAEAGDHEMASKHHKAASGLHDQLGDEAWKRGDHNTAVEHDLAKTEHDRAGAHHDVAHAAKTGGEKTLAAPPPELMPKQAQVAAPSAPASTPQPTATPSPIASKPGALHQDIVDAKKALTVIKSRPEPASRAEVAAAEKHLNDMRAKHGKQAAPAPAAHPADVAKVRNAIASAKAAGRQQSAEQIGHATGLSPHQIAAISDQIRSEDAAKQQAARTQELKTRPGAPGKIPEAKGDFPPEHREIEKAKRAALAAGPEERQAAVAAVHAARDKYTHPEIRSLQKAFATEPDQAKRNAISQRIMKVKDKLGLIPPEPTAPASLKGVADYIGPGSGDDSDRYARHYRESSDFIDMLFAVGNDSFYDSLEV